MTDMNIIHFDLQLVWAAKYLGSRYTELSQDIVEYIAHSPAPVLASPLVLSLWSPLSTLTHPEAVSHFLVVTTPPSESPVS